MICKNYCVYCEREIDNFMIKHEFGYDYITMQKEKKDRGGSISVYCKLCMCHSCYIRNYGTNLPNSEMHSKFMDFINWNFISKDQYEKIEKKLSIKIKEKMEEDFFALAKMHGIIPSDVKNKGVSTEVRKRTKRVKRNDL